MSPQSKNLVMQVMRTAECARMPIKGSALAAGFDLSSVATIVVPARGSAVVDTGLRLRLPIGTYGRVAPRSGLSVRHSIDVGAGVIDADYRGEIRVLLYNHSDIDFNITPGERVAQLILEKYAVDVEVEEVANIDDCETQRGSGGFGSTGV